MSKIPTDIGRSLHNIISDLCPFSFGQKNSANHCAHYVSHIMGYDFGATCKNFTWAEKRQVPKGASFRVNQLFNKTPARDLLANKPNSLTECLIFVTIASNVSTTGSTLRMGDNKRKHIGILTKGKVWNYSNTKDKVVADSLTTFQAKFSNAYLTSGTTVEFYYGKFI